ncbi:MAG TPA: hypothetical protein PKM73_16980 [Verrucomicrobiota bacterium]|nr:hypothetical protein [Verrucomicrobiota bacterium]HNU52931.1 hypothetical protein [Verrucomicrobiota bacterium]
MNPRSLHRSWRTAIAVALAFVACAAGSGAEPAGSSNLVFRPQPDGGFLFDTGLLRGRLHAAGKSLGLTEVTHRPSGTRLDRGNGLLSHYRVFTRGKRYGPGAWDWPSTTRQVDPATVAVEWPAGDRPFVLEARYRLAAPDRIEVETSVQARADLEGFEVFLASYFDAAFTNAVTRVKTPGGQADQEALPALGTWLMYPRDAAARPLIEDGRWTLEPHPVAWVFPADFAGPEATVVRRAPAAHVAVALSSPANDCVAVAMPHQAEGHYSAYFSLFGRTLKAGETARARVTLRLDPAERR